MTEKKADKILFNGRLITMEDEALAQAIAIKGDRIVYVGTTDEAMSYWRKHFKDHSGAHVATQAEAA